MTSRSSLSHTRRTLVQGIPEVEIIDQIFDDEVTHRTVINHLSENEGGIVAVAGFYLAGG